ncbi:recombination mediator RecR [Candidatus Magnetaquicoccus inordinatus]|uniref:recombination mediator RecR n=1 Tax=Candidatus Magnetaquicoccus inordinatus TaxID=2496818 RepID=UPI00102ACA81|nr:recombination mediator RecR [Candidatus Magnetaquicoccus inordinatus]
MKGGAALGKERAWGGEVAGGGLPAVEQAIVLLSRFPGVGRKSAQRMVHYLLRQGPEAIEQLRMALLQLSEQIRSCSICHNLAQGELCWICQDPRRDASQLCVLEEAMDLLAVEKAAFFRGCYHVLGGRLNPLAGIGPEHLHLDSLEERLRSGTVKELIIATNPTVEGEATAHFVAQMALPWVERITRLAYGMPMGGELEYLDESTLYQALAGRRPF